ncbi:MAG: alpha-amylase family glycosyl hydrolase [Bacteroidales bacterium]|nr:alpha-amylase family glycosyl hydrolase [Bacteroidales bacterium]
MKKFLLLFSLLFPFTSSLLPARAQGWPSDYEGVMLQGFYWDGFSDSRWNVLTKQADELSRYFTLVWIPQSGNCDGQSMGYNPKYYFDQNSTFGTEKELRTLISTFKQKGIGTIADVVINHRQNLSNWVDFPAETYKGVTYQMLSTDICSDDDGGKCKQWADQNGYKLSSNKDSGEGWDGMRDLDHASTNVQKCINAYEDYLLNDLGYAGFRYDVAKGFAAKYFGQYNATAKPLFSVGEVWDSNQTIKNWIDGTKVDGVSQSAAFDFQFRYLVRDAINGNNWSKLAGTNTLVGTPDYRRYSVTFVENHDTENRGPGAEQDPIKADTLAANAIMLALPGTPCIFLKHWMACKHDLKLMIEARHLVGITNTTTYNSMASKAEYYVARVKGRQEGQYLLAVVGKTPWAYTAPEGYKELCSGHHWRYLVSESVDTKGWDATVQRIEEETKAENQEDPEFTPHTATIYVRSEVSGWSNMNFYTWDSNNNTQQNGNWPGSRITATKEIDGKTWYYATYDIPTSKYYVNFVFSTGTGSPQSVDVTGVSEDRFFVITNQQSGGKYVVEDVSDATGITIPLVGIENNSAVYDLQGRRLNNASATGHQGIYINNGKKIVR